jgi:F-box only protein C-terminal region
MEAEAEDKLPKNVSTALEALSLYHRGGRYEAEGDLQNAILFYDKAFKLEPTLYHLKIPPPFSQKESIIESTNYESMEKFNEPTILQHETFPPLASSSSLASGWSTLPPDLVTAILLKCVTWYFLKPFLILCQTSPLFFRTFGPQNDFFWHHLYTSALTWMPADDFLKKHGNYFSSEEYNHLKNDLMTFAFFRQTTSSTAEASTESPKMASSMQTSFYSLFKAMYQNLLAFNGVYISKIIYLRRGEPSLQSSTSTATNPPIHVVTYYRYLKFFKSGRFISILSNKNPAFIIPKLVQHLTLLQQLAPLSSNFLPLYHPIDRLRLTDHQKALCQSYHLFFKDLQFFEGIFYLPLIK